MKVTNMTYEQSFIAGMQMYQDVIMIMRARESNRITMLTMFLILSQVCKSNLEMLAKSIPKKQWELVEQDIKLNEVESDEEDYYN